MTQTRNGSPPNQLPAGEAETFWDIALNQHNQRQSIWTQALADAYGQSGPPPNSGINKTTVIHNYQPPPQGAAAAAPAAKGLLSSPLAKAALVAAGIATGGTGIAALPMLSSLFKSAPAAEATPQQVEIGVDEQGKLFIPQDPPAGTAP